MMESREMARSCMNAASNVAGSIADHNVKNIELSSASTLKLFEYIIKLVSAKTGPEVIELSSAHRRNQLTVLGSYHNNLVDLFCKMPNDVAEPFKARAVLATCVIL